MVAFECPEENHSDDVLVGLSKSLSVFPLTSVNLG